MACADAVLCASASACAAVVLVPALPCIHAPFSPALWLLDAALLPPLICCAFAAPTTAKAVVSAPHWVEFDEHEGKFVGVEVRPAAPPGDPRPRANSPRPGLRAVSSG